eukprot:6459993-Amphidinium_carterae.1
MNGNSGGARLTLHLRAVVALAWPSYSALTSIQRTPNKAPPSKEVDNIDMNAYGLGSGKIKRIRIRFKCTSN